MLRDLLLVLNMLVCVVLIGVVLLQRSEGGGFGSGSPTGLVTARGAGDLLTRSTWVLFSMFLALSLALTLIGGRERSSQAFVGSLKNFSINPDQLAKPAPPPATPATPAAAPGLPGAPASQSAPPPVSLQLPPVTGAAPAQTARHPAPHKAAAPPATPPTSNIPAPTTLALPPIGGSTPQSAPAQPPSP